MITNGTCKFCGQTAMTAADTEEEAVYQATIACDCIEAMSYKEKQAKAAEAIARTEEMYSKEGVPEEIIIMMNLNIKHMAENNLKKVQYVLENGKNLIIKSKGLGFVVEASNAEKKKVKV